MKKIIFIRHCKAEMGGVDKERKLDEEIIGKVGYQRYEVNAFGKRIREIKIDEGQAGKSFKTTFFRF